MNWIKKKYFKDFILISLISLILLTIINFLFVYHSPILIKILPKDFAYNISPCYRTLYYNHKNDLSKVKFIFGDSYSEGMGDEFLNDDPEYGIYNKIENSDFSELIFGRSGYGNIGTVIEFERCLPLLSNFTNFSPNEIKKYSIDFVFYEGNDLNDNLIEAKRKSNNLIYKIKFFLPIYHYIKRKINYNTRQFKRKIRKTFFTSSKVLFPISKSGILIETYPQSAATELNERELQYSLKILKNSLEKIFKILPDAENYKILYIPSVASSYQFNNSLRVQSYKGLPFFTTTGEYNRIQNIKIRQYISEEISSKLKWKFCDPTSKILNVTNKGNAVHGPIDWKHFNKLGYKIVADVYKNCS